MNTQPKQGKLSDSLIIVGVIVFIAWWVLLIVVFVILAGRH